MGFAEMTSKAWGAADGARGCEYVLQSQPQSDPKPVSAREETECGSRPDREEGTWGREAVILAKISWGDKHATLQ